MSLNLKKMFHGYPAYMAVASLDTKYYLVIVGIVFYVWNKLWFVSELPEKGISETLWSS